MNGIAPDDCLTFLCHDPKTDGYYVARATSAAYTLPAETTLHELRDANGKPVVLPAGSSVVDAVYLNPVRGIKGTKQWYLPYDANDARGKVRVPTHFVLQAGFTMDAAPTPPRAPSKRHRELGGTSRKWAPADAREAAASKGAVVLPDEAHEATMDELDVRDN